MIASLHALGSGDSGGTGNCMKVKDAVTWAVSNAQFGFSRCDILSISRLRSHTRIPESSTMKL